MKDAKLYDQEYYKKLEFGFRSETRSDHGRIIELLEVESIDRVLEIGCGFGVLLKRIPSDKKTGIETNDVAIAECRKRGLSVLKIDAEKGLPFKDSSFHMIIMNEVIEHFKKPKLVLKECFRVLAPKGKIIITTPVRSFFVHDLSDTHFSEMTTKEMKELIQECGFGVLTHEVSGVSFLYPLMENLLFKPFRYLRLILDGRQKKGVELIDSCHRLADGSFLKVLTFCFYRHCFLRFGLSQLIFAQKTI